MSIHTERVQFSINNDCVAYAKSEVPLLANSIVSWGESMAIHGGPQRCRRLVTETGEGCHSIALALYEALDICPYALEGHSQHLLC